MKAIETIGIVLLNLGGPDSLQAVTPFLYNLFSDREIIKLGPSFMQKPIARLISTLRSPKTRKMYSLIGDKSPILDITMAQAKALEKTLNAEVKRIRSLEDKNFSISQLLNFLSSQPHFKVYTGMRYGHPFIRDTVQEAIRDGIKRFIVLSMYPQYSKATTGSAIAEFKKVITKFQISGFRFQIQYITEWYNFPPYIDSLAELIFQGITGFGEKDVHVLFSAHSLPEDFIKEGDPYVEHAKETIKAVLERLNRSPYNLEKINWHLSFQSRSGPVKWLKPSTDETIVRLANEGVKRLCVVPVSFVSDHVETLYEIDILYRSLAERHGMNLKRCEALNTSEKFITALKELVMERIAD